MSFVNQCEDFLDGFKVASDSFDFKHQDQLDETLKKASFEKEKMLNGI